MPKLMVFIGQCGCQIGSHLLDIISADDSHPLLSHGNKLLAIFVDTESKVLHCLQSMPAFLKYVDQKNVIFWNSMNTGNWIANFCDKVLLAYTMKAIKDELCRNADVAGLIVVHSMIGGTGGGFTSKLLQAVQEAHEEIKLYSFCVLPFSSGESSLQHYNSLLTIHWLNRFCDVTILFHNDSLLCDLTSKQYPRPSLYDMNRYIAFCTLALLSPLNKQSAKQTKIKTQNLKHTSYTRRVSDTYLYDQRAINQGHFYLKPSVHSASYRHRKKSGLSNQETFERLTYFSRYREDLATVKVPDNHLKDFSCTRVVDILEELSLNKLKRFYQVEFTISQTFVDLKQFLTSSVHKFSRYHSKKLKLFHMVLVVQSDNIDFDSEFVFDKLRKKYPDMAMSDLKVFSSKFSSSSSDLDSYSVIIPLLHYPNINVELYRRIAVLLCFMVKAGCGKNKKS